MVEIAATTAAPASTAPRVVPGAPIPTKSQIKKKKKASKNKSIAGLNDLADTAISTPKDAALVDHVPQNGDIAAALVVSKEEEKAVADAPVESESLHPSTLALAGQKPPSPIVDQIINKRIKAIGKKIQRVTPYSTKPVESLNEDQKRTLATLPNLEASLKELEDIKKGIEVLERENAVAQVHARAAEATEAEKRIAAAVSFTTSHNLTQTRSLLAFLSLSTILSAPIPVPTEDIGDHRLPSDENEKQAVIQAGRELLTPEFATLKEELLQGLLGIKEDGAYAGVEYSRLRQITQQFIHPPTPIPSPLASPVLAAVDPVAPEPTEEDVPAIEREATPTPGQLPTTGSFQFMSQSDIDPDPATSTSVSAEWVQVEKELSPVPEDDDVTRNAVLSEEVEKLVQEEKEDIQAQDISNSVPAAVEAAPVDAATIDWAADGDDHDDLPPIATLEETFGKSGAATPVIRPSNGQLPPADSVVPLDIPVQPPNGTNNQNGHNAQNGHNSHNGGSRQYQPRHSWGPARPQEDGDGFTSIPERRGGYRGGRGRGNEGRGGYGGEGRGGYRGRGGEDGYRGRGGARPPFEGPPNGEEHQGGRGGYRSRGGPNGEGFGRGWSGGADGSAYRGRGRGRGDFEGGGERRGGYNGGYDARRGTTGGEDGENRRGRGGRGHRARPSESRGAAPAAPTEA